MSVFDVIKYILAGIALIGCAFFLLNEVFMYFSNKKDNKIRGIQLKLLEKGYSLSQTNEILGIIFK